MTREAFAYGWWYGVNVISKTQTATLVARDRNIWRDMLGHILKGLDKWNQKFERYIVILKNAIGLSFKLLVVSKSKVDNSEFCLVGNRLKTGKRRRER